jgi:pyrroline-5-carboxylate reductase
MKIGVVGVGNMGQNMLKAVVGSKNPNVEAVFAFDVLPENNELARNVGAEVLDSVQDVASRADIIILAVKPKMLSVVGAEIRKATPKAVLSILAGCTSEALSAALGDATRIMNALPNLPLSVGAGVLGVADNFTFTKEEAQLVFDIFNSAGRVVQLKEEQLGVLSAVSGSGPAFVSMFVESLTDAGVKNGLPRGLALELAVATVEGTGKMLSLTKLEPSVLKNQVCSPGGTSIEGVLELEKTGFRASVEEAVNVTVKKWYA